MRQTSSDLTFGASVATLLEIAGRIGLFYRPWFRSEMTTANITKEETAGSLPSGPIVLFDAECVFCSANAQFVLTHDKTGRFHLASMQGAVGAALFHQHGLDPEDPTSILVIEGRNVRKNSDAVIAIYEALGFPWRAASLLRVVPSFLRDPIYRLIARNRYRLFGKRSTCWVPAERFRSRVL